MKASREQLERRIEQLEHDRTQLHLALNDVLEKRVTWFRKRGQALGISREASPSGGIVIHRNESYASAFYWEKWAAAARQACGASMAPEMAELRGLIDQAQTHINRVRDTAWNGRRSKSPVEFENSELGDEG